MSKRTHQQMLAPANPNPRFWPRNTRDDDSDDDDFEPGSKKQKTHQVPEETTIDPRAQRPAGDEHIRRRLLPFHQLLDRAVAHASDRPPGPFFAHTAAEIHINGSLSIYPRPGVWDEYGIYCPQCQAWGRSCVMGTKTGCQYFRYEKKFAQGMRCDVTECRYCKLVEEREICGFVAMRRFDSDGEEDDGEEDDGEEDDE